MSGVKFDEGKARYDLVPRLLVEEAAKVFAFGADKYGDRNWEKGISYGRLYAAMQRHLTAWWSGEEDDAESGLSHLGHAACCLMMLGEFALTDEERPEAAADTRPDRPETVVREKIEDIRLRALQEFEAGMERAMSGAKKLDTAMAASVGSPNEALTDRPRSSSVLADAVAAACPPPFRGTSSY